MGSGIYPKYETEIFHKLPNMLLLNVVIHFSVSGVLLRPWWFISGQLQAYAMSESVSIAVSPAPEPAKLFQFEKEEAIACTFINIFKEKLCYQQ